MSIGGNDTARCEGLTADDEARAANGGSVSGATQNECRDLANSKLSRNSVQNNKSLILVSKLI